MAAPSAYQVEAVTTLLHSIVREARRWVDSVAFAELGITFPQSIVLKVVRRSPQPPTASDVAERTGLAPSTISGIIKRLVRDGLLIRQADPEDLRVQRLYIAGNAEDILKRADTELHCYVHRQLSVFTQEELAALCDLLGRLDQAIRATSGTNP